MKNFLSIKSHIREASLNETKKIYFNTKTYNILFFEDEYIELWEFIKNNSPLDQNLLKKYFNLIPERNINDFIDYLLEKDFIKRE